jgi:hypothetical protein
MLDLPAKKWIPIHQRKRGRLREHLRAKSSSYGPNDFFKNMWAICNNLTS